MSGRIFICGTDTWPYIQQARPVYGDGAVYLNVDQAPEKFKGMFAHSGGKMQVPVTVEG